jgi:hypothetical protein
MTDKKEPTAWAAIDCNGHVLGVSVHLHNLHSDHVTEVVPLYSSQPTLTSEEREAIRFAEHEAQAFAEMGGGPHGFAFAATLRNLLERTGAKNVD